MGESERMARETFISKVVSIDPANKNMRASCYFCSRTSQWVRYNVEIVDEKIYPTPIHAKVCATCLGIYHKPA